MRRPIHDPGVPAVAHSTAVAYVGSTGTTINHFHEKLLLPRERMNDFGRKLAEERHQYMVGFLERFQPSGAGTPRVEPFKR